jgi:hypothetical protein
MSGKAHCAHGYLPFTPMWSRTGGPGHCPNKPLRDRIYCEQHYTERMAAVQAMPQKTRKPFYFRNNGLMHDD